MDLDEIKRGLRAEIKKMENEQYFTFQCNVRQMCKDVLAKLEEMEAENAELKKKLMPCLNGDCILTCEVVEKYGKENAELKQKLEDAQATAYAESVDAGMRERRLKRALWLARAERARIESVYWLNLMYDEKWSSVKFTVRRKHGANVKPRQTTRTPERWFNVWDVVELYCKHKAEAYK